MATDAGSPALSSSLSVLVLIDDVNDSSPVFKRVSYDVTVAADCPVGSFVTSVSATDVDSGLNARITYRFAARTQVRIGIDIRHVHAPV